MQAWVGWRSGGAKRGHSPHPSERGSMALVVTGECKHRIFGLQPVERLSRQLASAGSESCIAADASAVLSEGTLEWLQQNPGIVLISPSGRRIAVSQPSGYEDASLSELPTGLRTITS